MTGPAGTNFVTDIRIINNGGSDGERHARLLPAERRPAMPLPKRRRRSPSLPGEQKVLDDVIGARSASPAALAACASPPTRTCSPPRASSTTSAAKATARRASRSKREESGATSGTLSFLQSNADFRTNAGYFNPSSSSVTATFVARRTSNGAVLGTNTITIPGFAMVQQPVFSLISSVPDADRTQNDYYVNWTSSRRSSCTRR